MGIKSQKIYKKESMGIHTKNIRKIKKNISNYIKIFISRGGA